MTSLQQFMWVPNNSSHPLPSGDLSEDFFPYLTHKEFAVRGGNSVTTLRVLNKDMAVPRGIFCTADGQRCFVATVEGYIERAVLSMMMTDDALHSSLSGDKTNLSLSNSPISVGKFADPQIRGELTKLPRQRFVRFLSGNHGTLADLCKFPSTFLNIGQVRTHSDYNITVFMPSLNHGRWSGENWEAITGIMADNLFEEVDNSSSLQYVSMMREKLLDTDFKWHMTVDASADPMGRGYCYNCICLAIAKAFGVPEAYRAEAVQIEGATEEMPSIDAVGVMSRACMSGVDNYALSSKQPMDDLSQMGRLSAPYSAIQRLSAFHWAAAVACLDRIARWGACGWTQTYREPNTHYTLQRVKYPNQYASRRVGVIIQWSHTLRDFEVSYTNAPASWGNTVWENQYKCKYWENTNEEAEGQISWSRAFSESLFSQYFVVSSQFDRLLRNGIDLHMEAQMPNDAENMAGVRREDFGVMHIPASLFVSVLEAIAGGITSEQMFDYDGGGSVSAQKTFTATLPSESDDPTADATGLDQFPCKNAVDYNYIMNGNEHVYGIGKGEYYKTDHESEPQVEVGMTFFDIFKDLIAINYMRVEHIKEAMQNIAKRFGRDVETANAKIYHPNTVKSRQSILNWMNSFEFGEGTADYFYQKAHDSLDKVQWSAEAPYFDVYFQCVQRNGRWEPITILNFFKTFEDEWEDTDEYRGATYPINKDIYGNVYGYIFQHKYADVAIEPNRTDVKNAYSLYAQIAQWFGAVNWNWHAMTVSQ